MFPIVVLSHAWACLGVLGRAWACLTVLGHDFTFKFLVTFEAIFCSNNINYASPNDNIL